VVTAAKRVSWHLNRPCRWNGQLAQLGGELTIPGCAWMTL
jgi:hypothetical protein